MIKQATKTRKPKAQDVLILTRYFIKRNGHIVSIVLSSNGIDTYQVLTIDGAARSCTCPATKICKHIRAVQIAEENRTEKVVVAPVLDEKYSVLEAVLQIVNQAEADLIVGDAYEIEGPHKKVTVPVSTHDICQGCCKAYYAEHDGQIFCRRCC